MKTLSPTVVLCGIGGYGRQYVQRLTFVPGLTATMQACFESSRLFAETGVPWAHRAERLVCPTLDV